MGHVVDRMGCGVFMMPVENPGPSQSGYHLKIPAFMWRMQWDVKIYGGVPQICSFNIKAFPFHYCALYKSDDIRFMFDISSSCSSSYTSYL